MARITTFVAFSCILFAWCALGTPAQEANKIPDAVLVCKVTTLPRSPIASEVLFTSDGKRVVVLNHFTARAMPAAQPAPVKGIKKGAFGSATRSEPVVSVHDVTTGKELFAPLTNFTANDEPSTTAATVAISPTGKSLMTTSQGHVRFWDIESGKPVGATLEHGTNVISAALSKDGKRLLTATAPVSPFDRFPAQPVNPGKKKKGAELVQPGGGKGNGPLKSRIETRLWDVETGKPVGEPFSPGARCQVLWSPDGKSIVTTSSVFAAGVQFWDPTTMQPMGDPMHARCDTGHFSPDGKTLLAVSTPGSFYELTLWDIGTRKAISKTLSTVVRDDIPSAQYRSHVVQADGRTVLMCDGNQVQLWDMNAETPAKKSTFEHTLLVYWLAISADGKHAASAAGTFGRLGEITIWNVSTGRAMCRVPHDGLIHAMEFTPDGRSLATVNDRDVRLWRVDAK